MDARTPRGRQHSNDCIQASGVDIFCLFLFIVTCHMQNFYMPKTLPNLLQFGRIFDVWQAAKLTDSGGDSIHHFGGMADTGGDALIPESAAR